MDGKHKEGPGELANCERCSPREALAVTRVEVVLAVLAFLSDTNRDVLHKILHHTRGTVVQQGLCLLQGLSGRRCRAEKILAIDVLCGQRCVVDNAISSLTSVGPSSKRLLVRKLQRRM